MSEARHPKDCLLFSSIIFRDEDCLKKAIEKLEQAFGGIVSRSEVLPFDYTSYYEKEMGDKLMRVIVAFDRLAARNSLASIKAETNAIEKEFLVDDKRVINLDPGFLSQENVSLATTKPYSHRIYLDKGIWAEITLMFTKDSFHPLEWTYPDYSSEKMISIFNSLRNLYKEKLKCQEA